ncbi:hypothetical protein F5144DRAFT_562079, partial [Chaetomium tenue]
MCKPSPTSSWTRRFMMILWDPNAGPRRRAVTNVVIHGGWWAHNGFSISAIMADGYLFCNLQTVFVNWVWPGERLTTQRLSKRTLDTLRVFQVLIIFGFIITRLDGSSHAARTMD